MSRVGVVSLGCAKNRVDTERMLFILRRAGYEIVQRPELAEVLIVNTCGFIESAKQESIDTLLEMARYKETGVCKALVATGCLSERYRAELMEAMPELDVLTGVREYETLPGLLAARGLCGVKDALGACAPLVEGAERVLSTPPYRAFLRIGDGCDNRCAYCAIPLIRGALRSVPMEKLEREARALADAGVTELTLIAQDTSGYGADLYGRPMLPALLRRLEKIDGIRWLRVLYTYPDSVTPALIKQLAESEKLVNYLDMPLQHVSDAVLRRMHRRGTRAHIERVLAETARYSPAFILRTTFMVGFPGETERDFEELLDFLRAYPFDRVGAFAFSAEDGTTAAGFDAQVPEAVKAERLDRLLSAQRSLTEARGARRVGTETTLLIEQSAGDYTVGRSYAEAPDVDGLIYVPRLPFHKPGDYIDIRLTEARKYDMLGVNL